MTAVGHRVRLYSVSDPDEVSFDWDEAEFHRLAEELTQGEPADLSVDIYCPSCAGHPDSLMGCVVFPCPKDHAGTAPADCPWCCGDDFVPCLQRLVDGRHCCERWDEARIELRVLP